MRRKVKNGSFDIITSIGSYKVSSFSFRNPFHRILLGIVKFYNFFNANRKIGASRVHWILIFLPHEMSRLNLARSTFNVVRAVCKLAPFCWFQFGHHKILHHAYQWRLIHYVQWFNEPSRNFQHPSVMLILIIRHLTFYNWGNEPLINIKSN